MNQNFLLKAVAPSHGGGRESVCSDPPQGFTDAPLDRRIDDDVISHMSCGILRSRRLSANTSAAGPHVLQAQADAFQDAGFLGDVEELLIRLGVLHDQGGFAVDGEHDRLPGLFHLLDEIGVFCLNSVREWMSRLRFMGGSPR
jgi:hypothetical protein